MTDNTAHPALELDVIQTTKLNQLQPPTNQPTTLISNHYPIPMMTTTLPHTHMSENINDSTASDQPTPLPEQPMTEEVRELRSTWLVSDGNVEGRRADRRRYLESTDPPMLPLTDAPKTEEQVRYHRVFGYKVEQDNQDLVGRMFIHPGTGRLCEVSHIYWDPAHHTQGES
jgi:hypothetical protein